MNAKALAGFAPKGLWGLLGSLFGVPNKLLSLGLSHKHHLPQIGIVLHKLTVGDRRAGGVVVMLGAGIMGLLAMVSFPPIPGSCKYADMNDYFR